MLFIILIINLEGSGANREPDTFVNIGITIFKGYGDTPSSMARC